MSKKDWGVDDSGDTYWFNDKTGEVEFGPQSMGIDRVGPFKTAEEAAHAKETLAERARQWAAEEEEDNF